MARCKFCKAHIWWKVNSEGKYVPFNIDLETGQKTFICHYVNCTQKHKPKDVPKWQFYKPKIKYSESQKNYSLKRWGFNNANKAIC